MKAISKKCFFGMCSAAVLLYAQSAFEVASVKPAATGEIGGVGTYPGGRVVLRGCTFEHLVQEAFNVQPFQLAGEAPWMQTDRYDIDAKPPASAKSSLLMPAYPKVPPNPEQREMLQALLVERFQLKYHRENRDHPVYLLVKGNKTSQLMEPKDKNAYPWAGSLGGGAIDGDGLKGTNESMADLAKRLSPYVGREVLDRTGISGSFDFRIEYQAGDERPDLISMILTSVQGLGLKLQPSTAPVETIVIEHAEKPSAN